MRRVLAAAALAAGALMISACAGGSHHASAGGGCAVTPGRFLSTGQLPGYDPFLTWARVPLPIHGGPAGPSPVARQYACGAFEGYVTGLSLTGKYRAENNALAQKLRYKPANAPLVPLRGSIVSDRSHQVLEIYEGMYQFSTPGAAARFIQIDAPHYQRVGGGDAHADMPRPLPTHPPATAVSERSLWSSERSLDGAAGEQAIYAGGTVGTVAFTLSLQGGNALTWQDVQPYWQAAQARLMTLTSEESR